MNSESTWSRQTLAFGERLRPIASKLRRRMKSGPDRSEQVPDILSFLRRHLDRIPARNDRLADEVNQLGELLAVADSSEIAVYRGTARVEICLEGLLDDYDEVRGAVAGHADSEACRLLEKAYREMLFQIQGWLDEIVECLDDPTDALEERGLTSEEDQRQPIRLNLKLEAPPSFTTLTGSHRTRIFRANWESTTDHCRRQPHHFQLGNGRR